MEKIKRKGYMSMSQKQRLIELLSQQHELISGKFSTNFTKKIADDKWKDIAEQLNAIPGGSKNPQEWKRAWADLKTKIKSKNFQLKKYANKTGGGPSCTTQLNVIEEQILSLINPTTITGHINVAESQVDFSFENEIVLESIGDEIVNRNNELHESVVSTDNMVTESNTSLSIKPEKELDISTKVQSSFDNSGGQIECSKISDSVIIEKRSKKYQKPRSLAAVRLQKSVTATEQIAEIGRQKLEIKKAYYEQKIIILENKNDLLLRQVIAHEKQTSAIENIQTDLKDIASFYNYKI